MKQSQSSSWLFPWLIVALAVVVSAPAFNSCMYRSHEDVTMPIRVFEMARALKDGHFPVRWLPDIPHHYGYPLFNFYAPFVYYVATFIHLAGVDLLLSIQLTILLGFVLSGLGMYLFVKEVYGAQAGLAAAISYLFVPYHLVDIYVRGALSEFFAFAFLPFIFLYLRRLFVRGGAGPMALAALFYGLLVMTHNIVAYFFSPLCIMYIIFLYWERRSVSRLCMSLWALVLGLGISCFFWLPALAEMKYTNASTIVNEYLDIKNHFVYPWQFFDPSFQFGGSYAGPHDLMSFQLGAPQTVLLVVSFFVLSSRDRLKDPFARKLLIFFIVLTFVSIFFMMGVSHPVWMVLPLARFIQFPWRLLLFTGFFMSVIAGVALAIVNGAVRRAKGRNYVFIVAVALMVMMPFSWAVQGIKYSLKDSHNNIYTITSDDITVESLKHEFETTQTVGTNYGEYLARGIDWNLLVAMMKRGGSRTALIDLTRPVEGVTKKTGRITFDVDEPRPVNIILDIIYFPGWTVTVDGAQAHYDLNDFLITFDLPAGPHHVEAVLEDTPVRTLANRLSAGAILLLLVTGGFALNEKSRRG